MLQEGVRANPDVSALASLDGNKLFAMVWHYHDHDVPGREAEVKLQLHDLPPRAGDLRVRHFRIDAEHSNAYAEWQRMGSTQQPTAEQYAQLEKAGYLAEGDEPVITDEGGSVFLGLRRPRQAVSLIVIEW